MAKIVILGTIQDAGIPQLNCSCINCTEVIEKKLQKYVSSIAIIGDNKALIIDATPDLPKQYNLLKNFLNKTKITIHSLLVTHLHIGHYTGLIYFGRESSSTNKFPIYLTKQNSKFLKANKPYSYLFERNELQEKTIEPGKPLIIDDSLTIIPFLVPHRNEDGNTIGIEIVNSKNTKRAVYIPDIDYLPDNIKDKINLADKVLLDGTFYEKSDIMRQKEVPHPPIKETVKIFGKQPENKFYFIHINHSNPVLNQTSVQYKEVTNMNYKISEEKMIIDF